MISKPRPQEILQFLLTLLQYFSISTLLTFWIWYFFVGASPVHCSRFIRVPGLYPLDVRSEPPYTPPHSLEPQFWQQKWSVDIAKCPVEWGKITQVENQCSIGKLLPREPGWAGLLEDERLCTAEASNPLRPHRVAIQIILEYSVLAEMPEGHSNQLCLLGVAWSWIQVSFIPNGHPIISVLFI